MRAAGFILGLLSSSVAVAQTASPVEHPIGGATFQASIRSRLEVWNWFQPDSADPDYVYSGNLLRAGFSKSADKFDWQVEFAVPFLLGLPDQATAPGVQGQLGLGATYFSANGQSRNTAMIFPKQVFWRWKNSWKNNGHSLRIGRFEFGDGTERAPSNTTLAALKRDRIAQRLIGPFGWTHVAHSLDGFQYVLSRPSSTFTLLAAIPTRGVFQTDGWGETRTAVAYAAFTRAWGHGRHTAETRGLGIYYHDWRHVVKTDSRPLAERRADLANIRIGTFGGHHASVLTLPSATWDFLLWGVAQTGRWGRLDHRAQAFAAEAGFQPSWSKRWKPWLRAGFFESSGDANPADRVHESFFQLLPTPRPFDRFPFFNMMNNRDLNAALISRPSSRVTISNEFHALRLSSANDLWYAGGGVFQPWSFGYNGRAANGARSLANLYDAQLDYTVNAHASVTGYFGYAQGLAVPEAIYPRGKNARLQYLELVYRF